MGTTATFPTGPTAAFLRSRFAFTDEEVLVVQVKLERKFPDQDLDLDPARAEDVLGRLQSRFSLNDDELRRLVTRQPAILTLRFADNIEPSLVSLKARLTLSEPELKGVVLTMPFLLGSSFEAKAEPLLAGLQSQLSLSDPELQKVVLGFPRVLSSNHEHHLRTKIDFFMEAFRFTRAELRERILSRPTLLSYSLEERYRPRIALATALQVDATPNGEHSDITLRPSGRYTDAAFMVWLRNRERIGVPDAEWEALCALPIKERPGRVAGMRSRHEQGGGGCSQRVQLQEGLLEVP